MKQQYKYVPCTKCNTTLRLKISGEKCVRTVEATCPRCRQIYRTTIINEEKIDNLTASLDAIAQKILLESKLFYDAMKGMNEAGLRVRMMPIWEITLISQEESLGPKVKNWTLNPETFSPDDKILLKGMKITLE